MDKIKAFLLPPAASTVAHWWDDLFNFLMAVSLVFFIPLIGLILYFAFKYNHKKNPVVKDSHGNTPLEILWTAVPTILVVFIFAWGWLVYTKMVQPPKDALEIRVTGKTWDWKFGYDNGKETVKELIVPVGRRIKLFMTSEDFIHSFFLPDFRVKKDVVPGLYSSVWFEAPEIGEHQIYCSEYCGQGHSKMLATLKVVSLDEWLKFWNIKEEAPKTPQGRGAKLVLSKSCLGCHSVDGSASLGPTFKGLWNKNETLADGSKVLVDREYIRNKILTPQKGGPGKAVKGFVFGVMPPFQGQIKEDEILDIIAYIKSLK